MKTLLVMLSLVAAVPAWAGNAYPPDAKMMADRLSQWNSVARVCGNRKDWLGDIPHQKGAVFAQARAIAKANGWDWNRIERNAKSRNRNFSKRDCDGIEELEPFDDMQNF
jgi:hypothetical protein